MLVDSILEWSAGHPDIHKSADAVVDPIDEVALFTAETHELSIVPRPTDSAVWEVAAPGPGGDWVLGAESRD